MVLPLKSTHGTVSDSLPIDGQIAGAHYGVDLLPAEWRERVAMREMFSDLADRLLDASLVQKQVYSALLKQSLSIHYGIPQ